MTISFKSINKFTAFFSMALIAAIPLVSIAAVTGIETQNIVDEGRDFAYEFKTIEQCSSGVDHSSPYRDIFLKHYRWKRGAEKYAILKNAFERTKISSSEIEERDCLPNLFRLGKQHQSRGVELAVNNANANLIPKTLLDANQAVTFGMQIGNLVSDAMVGCIPEMYVRVQLLAQFRPLVERYMQFRFNLQRGFETSSAFTSGFFDLFGYETELTPSHDVRSKSMCASDIYRAGQTVRLLEQLNDLKPTPTGIWLDRRLRGVK